MPGGYADTAKIEGVPATIRIIPSDDAVAVADFDTIDPFATVNVDGFSVKFEEEEAKFTDSLGEDHEFNATVKTVVDFQIGEVSAPILAVFRGQDPAAIVGGTVPLWVPGRKRRWSVLISGSREANQVALLLKSCTFAANEIPLKKGVNSYQVTLTGHMKDGQSPGSFMETNV